jgi:hypothetical protein
MPTMTSSAARPIATAEPVPAAEPEADLEGLDFDADGPADEDDLAAEPDADGDFATDT